MGQRYNFIRNKSDFLTNPSILFDRQKHRDSMNHKEKVGRKHKPKSLCANFLSIFYTSPAIYSGK